MKKRKGRNIDHTWEFVRYNGDIAYYARCKCGFRYSCNKNKSNSISVEPAPDKLYPYCPICGARKTRYIEEVRNIDKFSWE